MRKMFMALGAAAILATLGGTAAQASTHATRPDATPACGANCFDLSSLVLGHHLIQNAYIRGDNGVGGRVGQFINLKTATNTSPNEDFSGAAVGDLGDYCGSLIPGTSYVCENYPAGYPVFESNWAPYGNASGLCAGVATANVNHEPVTLQECGVTARTLWVGDLENETVVFGSLYTPWVNASDPNFSHPLALTVGGSKGRPAFRLSVSRLNTLTGNVVPDTQEFTLQAGPAA
ncbi:MAG TPA: hypothetical protein VMR14_24860 [Streptosporangiaceae bacterium]|jgi:hypothetical protein|nr:hypothetical protein [Streptosporangiaceae bacterium]